MKFKKTIITSLIAFSLAAQSHASGIPVVDVAGLAQSVQQVFALKQQIENQISQIKQMENQVKSLTGSRNLGQILNNPELAKMLPNEWSTFYADIKSGNYKGAAKTIAEEIKKKEAIKTNTDYQARIVDTLVNNKALNIDTLEKTKARLENIQSLMVEANKTQDAKASADLTNRMLAENASIQTDQMRINLMLALQANEERLARDKAKAEFKSNVTSH